MTEYWGERVVTALVEALDAIQGDGGTTYWYTPHVLRTHAANDHRIPTEAHEVIFVLAPFETEISEQAGGQHIHTQVIDFMLLRRHMGTDEPYRPQLPLRWTIQQRLLGDFLNRILGDVTLGGVCDNIEIRQVVLSATETYEPGWVVVKGQIAPTRSLDGAWITAT